MRRLCGEGSRSYLGRSRLMAERPTGMTGSEKSAEVVVVDSNRRRAEREGRPRDEPLGKAGHQKPGQPGGVADGEGEARAEAATDEAEPAWRAQTGRGVDDLLGQALTRENLVAAWKRVKANKGSAGVDGRAVQDTGEYLKSAWPALRSALLDGSYRPQPVRRVGIPKPGGGVRELGIPTVVDRLIQQALLQVLQPLIDPTFSEHSQGFRPGRSAHGAVLEAQQHVQAGHRWVVDVDLEKFFDRVNHEILMDRLAKRIADKRVLKLIRLYLQAGILAHGVSIERHEGTPQGGPLSPLLANVLLDEVDRELERRGHRFVRYADDCNVYVGSRKAGERVLSWRASQQRGPQTAVHRQRQCASQENANGGEQPIASKAMRMAIVVSQRRTYMKTYSAIKAEIAKLEKQAQALRKTEVAGVIAKIKEAIAAYALTAADLGLGRGAKAARTAAAKHSKKTSTTTGVAKYR